LASVPEHRASHVAPRLFLDALRAGFRPNLRSGLRCGATAQFAYQTWWLNSEARSSISRVALDRKVEGSNPSSPANSILWSEVALSTICKICSCANFVRVRLRRGATAQFTYQRSSPNQQSDRRRDVSSGGAGGHRPVDHVKESGVEVQSTFDGQSRSSWGR